MHTWRIFRRIGTDQPKGLARPKHQIEKGWSDWQLRFCESREHSVQDTQDCVFGKIAAIVYGTFFTGVRFQNDLHDRLQGVYEKRE